MRYISTIVAEYAVKNKLLSMEKKAWLIYILQKYISAILIICIIEVTEGVLNKALQAAMLTVTILSLRRIIGGWHANTIIGCYMVSLLCIIGTIHVLTPLLVSWEYSPILLSALSIYAFKVKPIYPKQCAFSDEVVRANLVKKNRRLMLLYFNSFFLEYLFPSSMVIIMLGINIAMGAVLIEYIIQKGGKEK